MTDHSRSTDHPTHDQLLIEYKSAWEEWIEGETEPAVDHYLLRIPSTQRGDLRAALELIEQRYRRSKTVLPSASDRPSAETIDPDQSPVSAAPNNRNDQSADDTTAEMSATGSTTADLPPTSDAPAGTMVPQDQEATRLLETSAGASAKGAEDDGFDVTMSPPGQDSNPNSTGKAGGVLESFDDYEIIGELGRGGMGVVYRAREKSTQRIVCVKMMLAGDYASPEAVRRFHIETEAAAHLDHPNIVPIYRAGEVNGTPYFVMKYIDGTGLERMQRDQLKHDSNKVARLVSKICRAVHFAHARGILHRDLKPANILIDDQGEPHITDFGLAKKIDDDSGQTRTGMIMGTPDYMSPEQATGRNDLVTVTSDVYALGSILFDLLTGQPPFKSATLVETLTRVTKEPARTPTVLNQQVDRDLETICLKCLEKDPNKRYDSAAELADELDRYLRGEPILSRPVGSTERLWRWCGRNPVVAGMSAALLALLVTVAVGSSIAAYQINTRRNEAVTAHQEAETARRLADQNAKAAEAHGALAIDTLHSLVTDVETKLRDRPDLAELQEEILQDALRGLQEVSRTSENSGRADRTTGVAYQRMADILEKLGKTGEAVKQHEQALVVFETLLAADPEDEWAKWNAAISYDKLGNRVRGTDVTEALKLYRKSTALREQLAGSDVEPDISSQMRRHALAISAANVGGLTLAQGDPAGALDYFRQALVQSESMLRDDPDNQRAKMAVAGSCTLLGSVSFRLGQWDAAHDYYHRALEMRQDLFRQDPESVTATNLLAKSYDALGDFELQTEQTRDALQYYQEAVKLLEGLFALDRANALVKNDLSTMYYKLATTHLRLDHREAAQPIYAKCLTLREELAAADEGNPQRQIALMLAQARCGQHESAANLASQLQERAAENPEILFYVACGYALCADGLPVNENDEAGDQTARNLKSTYENSALETLQKATELGYRDIVALETDPDLDPIRSRPEFSQMLTRLKKRPESAL